MGSNFVFKEAILTTLLRGRVLIHRRTQASTRFSKAESRIVVEEARKISMLKCEESMDVKGSSRMTTLDALAIMLRHLNGTSMAVDSCATTGH